ncbi:hypothetical protein MNBD_GAMMA12-2455 [hydrothermal vent metagenome]|uniref:Uncharacterized protein n=1 Tax=hydrothermal vent metagenome TaxID=652676 RepID=A0A3B0YDT6_9ZZZZ
MFARLTIKTIWLGICAVMGLVLSASSYADYLYKGHYYKNRQDGSVYQVPSRHKNHHRKNRKHRKYRTHRRHRLHGHSVQPHMLPAHNNLRNAPRSSGGSNFQNNHGKFNGMKGHRVEGAGHPGSNSKPRLRPEAGPGKAPRIGPNNFSKQAPAKHYKKACKSVDDAIWAAQRIYPGGRIISAKPIIDRSGRRTSVEIRIMYRGSVKLIKERC